jgi:hypothetical protein
MLYFAEFFSGLVAKSSKFYQEHPANQPARRLIDGCSCRRAATLQAIAAAFPVSTLNAEDL